MSTRLCVDFSRCILCHACEVACEREHRGGTRIHLIAVDHAAAVPIACRHCQSSPCVTACPEQALIQEGPDRVRFLADRCTGCSLCVFACPFGAIDLERGSDPIIRKCDLCTDRLERGSRPACVLTCPTGAIDYTEPDGWVGLRRRKEAVRLLEAQIEQA